MWALALAVFAGLALLWTLPVAPEPARWLMLVAVTVPAQLTPALPLAGGVAAVHVAWRWRREGALVGLAASGLGTRVLLVPAVLLGLLGLLLTGLWTHQVSVRAHQLRQQWLTETTASVALLPGQPIEVGDWTLLPQSVSGEQAEQVLLVGPELAGSARTARVGQAGDAVALVLTDGVLFDGSDRLTFTRYVHPLTLQQDRRIQLDERSSLELARVVARTREAGRDASYEAAVLHKRSTHPLVALLLPVALLPLAGGRRPALGTVAAGLGWLVMIRVGDQLAQVLGAWPSALAGAGFVALWGVFAWLRWRER